MASEFVSPKAMRLAVILAEAGTPDEVRHLSLRVLREAWDDLSETERVEGLAAETRDTAELLARMGADLVAARVGVAA